LFASTMTWQKRFTREITPLKNNYNGATPDPDYIPGWQLTLDGLASGVRVALDIHSRITRFSIHEQITGAGVRLRGDDLLRTYPPASQASWVRVESSVNLEASGNPDPYYVSIDLATARHSQTLLATHWSAPHWSMKRLSVCWHP
jgi:hypothetical protein